MPIASSLIDNIAYQRINVFLRKQNISERRNNKRELLEELLADNRIVEQDLNEFLYDELMYGKQRLMRVYELKSTRHICKETEWNQFLRKFQCDNLDFNKIITTNMMQEDGMKIAAIKSQSENGILTKVEILFLFNMLKGTRKTSQVEYVYSYIPTIIDIENKILIIKVWNREQGAEGYTPIEQLDVVYQQLVDSLNVDVKFMENKAQNVLYRMSRDLFDGFLGQLPNIAEIEAKKDELDDISNSLLSGITWNTAKNVDGKIILNPEVMQLPEELYKLIQQIALFDYLKGHDIKSLLRNTDKYVARIRFNDKDNLSASLTGEKGVKCIYDAKTFMCIRNSLDIVERIVAIMVAFVKDDNTIMYVKYEACDGQFINIHILHDKYYDENDFAQIWELYKKYENADNEKNGAVYSRDNNTTMQKSHSGVVTKEA